MTDYWIVTEDKEPKKMNNLIDIASYLKKHTGGVYVFEGKCWNKEEFLVMIRRIYR